jgi:putative glutamine amidotransferase
MQRPIIGIPTRDARDRSEYSMSAAYCSALEAVGGLPVLLPLLQDEESLRLLYENLSGVLLAGGGDIAPELYAAAHPHLAKYVDRERDRVEMLLARWALADGKPILGICRGIQSLNVAAGGTLIEDIPKLVPGALRHRTGRDLPLDYPAHEVELVSGSLLGRVLGEGERVTVNSRHHQALAEVAAPFRVVATAPDGVIEAIELPPAQHPFALGVQWHPENMVPANAHLTRLFASFVKACAGEADCYDIP